MTRWFVHVRQERSEELVQEPGIPTVRIWQVKGRQEGRRGAAGKVREGRGKGCGDENSRAGVGREGSQGDAGVQHSRVMKGFKLRSSMDCGRSTADVHDMTVYVDVRACAPVDYALGSCGLHMRCIVVRYRGRTRACPLCAGCVTFDGGLRGATESGSLTVRTVSRLRYHWCQDRSPVVGSDVWAGIGAGDDGLLGRLCAVES